MLGIMWQGPASSEWHLMVAMRRCCDSLSWSRYYYLTYVFYQIVIIGNLVVEAVFYVRKKDTLTQTNHEQSDSCKLFCCIHAIRYNHCRWHHPLRLSGAAEILCVVSEVRWSQVLNILRYLTPHRGTRVRWSLLAVLAHLESWRKYVQKRERERESHQRVGTVSHLLQSAVMIRIDFKLLLFEHHIPHDQELFYEFWEMCGFLCYLQHGCACKIVELHFCGAQPKGAPSSMRERERERERKRERERERKKKREREWGCGRFTPPCYGHHVISHELHMKSRRCASTSPVCSACTAHEASWTSGYPFGFRYSLHYQLQYLKSYIKVKLFVISCYRPALSFHLSTSSTPSPNSRSTRWLLRFWSFECGMMWWLYRWRPCSVRRQRYVTNMERLSSNSVNLQRHTTRPELSIPTVHLYQSCSCLVWFLNSEELVQLGFHSHADGIWPSLINVNPNLSSFVLNKFQ